MNCAYRVERDESEASSVVEAHVVRPKNPELASDKASVEYVFVRSNPKGVFDERWVHTHGCRRWYNAVRYT